MRGKASDKPRERIERGITPAYAGKSTIMRDDSTKNRDHPRVCGEKRKFILRTFSRLGSPPRMRGKGSVYGDSLKGAGITPAYAGKRPCMIMATTPAKDHPRVCGEKLLLALRSVAEEGSPPRMRGKVDSFKAETKDDRITPAYAGKREIRRFDV